jgi:OOP family OmpA-OmpF porin
MRFARFALSLPLLFAAFPSSVAFAQSLPSIDARTWRPSTDPSAGLVLEPTTTPGAWSWNVGALANYSYRPVSVTLNEPLIGTTTLRPVESLFGLDLVAGLGLGHHIAVGLDLPTAIYQTGAKDLPLTVASSNQVPSSAIGDLALTVKSSLIDNAQGGFGLAALASLTVPTGDPKSFLGEGSATVSARIVADYTLLVASVQASLGYTLRIDDRTWPAADVGGNTYGESIPWSVAIALKPDIFKIDKGHRQRWELGFHGWIPAGPVAAFGGTGAAQLSPAIASLGDRIEIGHYRDSYVLVGAEAGMTNPNANVTGSPLIRGILGIGWAPRNHDLDGDGVPDDVDQCPELPEDRDNFEDRDGCPEIDNDDDGVLDKDDACPNVAGVPSSDPKKNGCPQPDRDKDGVPDSDDACPDAKGLESDDPKTNGCPMSQDRDKDGILDKNDRCPDQPEDKDGFEDEDGCPDPDNDGDGIADAEDACPKEPGASSSDAKVNGCPSPDRDGDTYDDADDKCPNEAETFNGVKDDDGCPDTNEPSAKTAKPIVVVATDGPAHAPQLKLSPGEKLTPGGTTARAIVVEANRHRDWTLLVAIRGAKGDVALAHAAELADTLDKLAHRDLAEAVAWDAVKKEPATTGDVKIVVVVGGKKDAALAPLPPAPVPAVRQP